MTFLRLLLASSSVLLLGNTAAAQSYTPLPGVSSVADITPDGEVIVGSGLGGGYYWRWKTDPAPTFIGGLSAVAISDDGSVIAGTIYDPVTGNKHMAGRWTQATGWVPLGGLGSSCDFFITTAYDMNADGTMIVGLGWTGCSGQGFLWKQGGTPTEMVGLEHMWNGNNRASAISADGSVAVGFAQGNFTRTPARWTTADQLGVVPDPDDNGEYFGVTDDGSILLGGRNGYAYFEENGVETNIGNLNPGWTGRAVDASESGGTIIGYDVLLGGTEAWVWNPVGGMTSLQNRLLGLGVPGVPYLGYASAITPDGKTVVGQTSFQGAWVVEIPPGPIAKPFGCGFNNPPGSLTHTAGSSSVGGVIRLGVDDPTGTMVAPAFAFVSYSLQPAPNYPCGIPLPGFAMFGPTADLLISVAAPNPILQQTSAALWTTPGQPVTVDFSIPLDTGLFGIQLFAQGALFSPSTAKIGLTSGIEFTIGLP